MQSKKKLLRNSKLYLILDREVNDYHRLFEILRQAVQFGVDIVQLRDKHGSARDILDFSKEAVRLVRGKIPFLVNDRVDLAWAARAFGVHLGQEDLPFALARKIMGEKAIIGASCQSLEQARIAERGGADYIGFGSVFQTLTKPDRQAMDPELLRDVVKKIKIPVFAIGGINLQNVTRVCRLGVEKIAVCRAIGEAEQVDQAIMDFRQILDNRIA
ncbi:MAG: thiamine phosphate synthase [Candidatus Omnitrophota bacterium]